MCKYRLLIIIFLVFYLFHTSISSSFGQTQENVQIDVLLVYTQAAKNHEGGTVNIEKKISQLVAELNQTLENSKNTTRFRVVGIKEVRYSEQAGSDSYSELHNNLTTLVQSDTDVVKEIHDLRNTVGADITFVVGKLAQSGCGVAYTLPKDIFDKNNPTDFSKFTFGLYNTKCSTLVFAHEVSHIMGNNHGGSQVSHAVTSEAFAHLFTDTSSSPPRRRSTITGGGGEMIPYWSDPNITYNGIKIGETGKSCESCVLNLTKKYISDIRNQVIDDQIQWTTTQLKYENGKAVISGTVTIPYSIVSISVDNGKTWNEVVANTTRIVADLMVLPTTTSFQYKINNGLVRNQSIVVTGEPGSDPRCVSLNHNISNNLLQRGQPISLTAEASVPISLFRFSFYNRDNKDENGIPTPYCVEGATPRPGDNCPPGSGQLVIQSSSSDRQSLSVTAENKQVTQVDTLTQKIPINIQVNATFVTNTGIGINDDGNCVVRFINETPLSGDFDRNCKADIYDYNLLLEHFNKDKCAYNMTGSCKIENNDISSFIPIYGSSCR